MSIQIKNNNNSKAGSFSDSVSTPNIVAKPKNVIVIEPKPKQEEKKPKTIAQVLRWCIMRGGESIFTRNFEAVCGGRCPNGIMYRMFIVSKGSLLLNAKFPVGHTTIVDKLVSMGIENRVGVFLCPRCSNYIGSDECWFGYHMGMEHGFSLSRIANELENAIVRPSIPQGVKQVPGIHKSSSSLEGKNITLTWNLGLDLLAKDDAEMEWSGAGSLFSAADAMKEMEKEEIAKAKNEIKNRLENETLTNLFPTTGKLSDLKRVSSPTFTVKIPGFKKEVFHTRYDDKLKPKKDRKALL